MLEIERKFLLSRDNYETVVQQASELFTTHRLEQVYLRKQDPEVRIRRELTIDKHGSSVSHFLTIKDDGGMIRDEQEHVIDMSLNAWAALVNTFPSVAKVRNKGSTVEGYELVIDRVLSSLEDIYLCEVEFPSLKEAEAWEPLSWMGEEVTGNPDYKMVNLCE